MKEIRCPNCGKARITFEHVNSVNPLTHGLCLVLDQFWHDREEDSYTCMYDGYKVSEYRVFKLRREVENEGSKMREV